MDHDSPVVREFSSDEWPVYRDLRLRALRDSPNAFGSTLAREMAFTDQEWFTRLSTGVISPTNLPMVAEMAELPIGLAWVRVDEGQHDSATLYQVWVDANYRRHGVGRLLIETACDWGRTTGVKQLTLSVSVEAESAMKLYLQTGFVAYGAPIPLRPESVLMQQPMRRLL